MDAFPKVVARIPVAGPDPFNTLVSVSQSGYGAGTGVVTQRVGSFGGGWSKTQMVFKTEFWLIGYDPRQRNPFVHSTSVVMHHMGTTQDFAFQFSIDDVFAGFDDHGCWTVIADLVTEVPEPPFFGGPNLASYAPYVSSWVLCHEPPLEQHTRREQDPRLHRFTGGDR
jgi:hypothetical protein